MNPSHDVRPYHGGQKWAFWPRGAVSEISGSSETAKHKKPPSFGDFNVGAVGFPIQNVFSNAKNPPRWSFTVCFAMKTPLKILFSSCVKWKALFLVEWPFYNCFVLLQGLSFLVSSFFPFLANLNPKPSLRLRSFRAPCWICFTKSRPPKVWRFRVCWRFGVWNSLGFIDNSSCWASQMVAFWVQALRSKHVMEVSGCCGIRLGLCCVWWLGTLWEVLPSTLDSCSSHKSLCSFSCEKHEDLVMEFSTNFTIPRMKQ